MDSKFVLPLCAVLLLGACSDDDGMNVAPTDVAVPAGDQGYDDDANVTYWYSTHVTADTAPDPVKAQQLLEEDLVACGYEVRDHRRWATNNDPVSNPKGDVVDKKGVDRSDTSLPLPSSYELWSCMEGKGWIHLKHYYTTPY